MLGSQNENILKLWFLILIPDCLQSFVTPVTEHSVMPLELMVTVPCLSSMSFFLWCEHVRLGVAVSLGKLASGSCRPVCSHSVSTDYKKIKFPNHCKSLLEQENICMFSILRVINQRLSCGKMFWASLRKPKFRYPDFE